jgi:hypothetical protein
MTTTQTTEALQIPTYSGVITIESGAAHLTSNGRHVGFIDLTTPITHADHGDWVAVAHNSTGAFRVSMTELAAVILSQALHLEMGA